MTRYEGLPCTICGEKFNSDSDVVVCPKCGAPYHRDCYKEKGECVFADKHDSDFLWELPIDQLPPERITVCLKCKTPNAKENLFCKNCGNKLDENVKVVSVTKIENHEGNAPFSNTAEESFGGISAKEISAYVGNNSFYFLKRFRLLLGTQINISWNWPAFFFKFIYFFYRKMYKIGALLLVLSIMLTAPSLMYSVELIKSQSMELFGVAMAFDQNLLDNLLVFLPAINILNAMYSFGCGIMANKLFMQKTLSDIKLARQSPAAKESESKYFEALALMGRTDKLSVIIFVTAFLGVYVKIVANLTALLR